MSISSHTGLANTLQGPGPSYGRNPPMHHSPSNEEYREKRRRITRACDNCKTRKRRCTGEKPCSYCVEHSAQCSYDLPYTRGKQTEPQSTSPANGSGYHADNFKRDTQPQWPRDMLVRTNVQPTISSGENQHSGGLSSRARSPETSTGQYLGPTSAFSVRYDLGTRMTEQAVRCSQWLPHSV